MTTPPPPQESNRAAYVLPIGSMTEPERRLIRAYLDNNMNATKTAELERTTRQRVVRIWRRWKPAIYAAI